MKKSCPLADPEIGIISENDHRVGLCLCRYCVCGQHQCPSKVPKGSLAYRSNYQSNFSPKKFDIPLRMAPQRYKRSALKMDLNTIHGTDFVAFPSELKPNKPTEKQTTHKLEMVSETLYKSDFRHWGMLPVVHEKTWHPPKHNEALVFSGTTSYRRSFNNATPTKQPSISPLYSANQDNIKFQGEMHLASTYRKDMKNFSDVKINTPYHKQKNEVRAASISPNHFSTISRIDYQSRSLDHKDPKYLRVALNHHN